MVTIPHNLDRTVRKRLVTLGPEAFLTMLRKIHGNLRTVLDLEHHAVPTLRIVQRRYSNPKTKPFVDATMDADIRTAIDTSGSIKPQPQWIEAAYSAFSEKKSNLQMQIGVIFPIERCRKLRSENALGLISKSWSGCAPLFEIAYPTR